MLRPTWRYLPMMLRPTDFVRPEYGRKIDRPSFLAQESLMIIRMQGRKISMDELDAGFGAAVSTADDNLATDAKWQNYADILHRVAQQVVGKPQKKNQDWFDESDSEIRRLVERSRLALGGAIDARHRSSIQRDLKVKI
ncbi:hypothetical protein ACJJTC_016408 [Scirpophaga incertulas]